MFKKCLLLILSILTFTASAVELPVASCFLREAEKPSRKSCEGMGTAVIITGISGVGKSSAISELENLLDESWVKLAVDSKEFDKLMKKAKDSDFPEITNLIPENHMLLKRIRSLTSKGMNVLCDTVLVSQEALSEFQHRISNIGCPVLFILLDCKDIQILFDNLEKRNRSKNKKERRLGIDVATQYLDLHRPKPMGLTPPATPSQATASSSLSEPYAASSSSPITDVYFKSISDGLPQSSPSEDSVLSTSDSLFSRPDSPCISMEQVRWLSNSPVFDERQRGFVFDRFTREFNLAQQTIVELTQCCPFSKVIYVDGKGTKAIATEIYAYISSVVPRDPSSSEEESSKDEDGDFGDWDEVAPSK